MLKEFFFKRAIVPVVLQSVIALMGLVLIMFLNLYFAGRMPGRTIACHQ